MQFLILPVVYALIEFVVHVYHSSCQGEFSSCAAYMRSCAVWARYILPKSDPMSLRLLVHIGL